MTWVTTIDYRDAEGMLREAYDRARPSNDEPDPLYVATSLRPATIDASDALYRSVLHCDDNVVEPWLLELVSAFTAQLLGCRYAVHHHRGNFVRHVDDAGRADEMWDAAIHGGTSPALDDRARAFLEYSRRLTLDPASVSSEHVQSMRDAGATDGEIVEVNQVCASFNYFARTLNGLGVELDI